MIKLLATWGLGLMPKAPGTWGTLGAIPILWLLSGSTIEIKLLVTVILFVIGVWVSNQYTLISGVHDASEIIIDEVVGMLVAAIWFNFSWMMVIAAFVFFRIFDILKPPPVGSVDRKVRGGMGIMLDDVFAGIYAAIMIKILLVLEIIPVT